ncbi:MAG: ATP-dependent RecD-like DNA helicase [Chlamydiae bacterium]|nr:ATP-dependent RecD-like DNA helicase [Chlamydiota bacterium]
MQELFGYIERITFQNPENGFTVAWLKSPKQKDLICIVGSMTSLQPGETVRCVGEWQNHMVHGRQFSVTDCQLEAPSDILGIKKYLGSGLVKGIGPVYAERIVEKFGIETLHVIDQNPESLQEIPGIGKKRIEQIKSCWDEQKVVRDVMIFLQSQDISPAFAQKIFKTYGDQSIEKIKDNPFNLARDIFGIGFKSADKVASKMGIAKDSPKRVDAGIEYVLSELSQDGHMCYPVDEFTEAAKEVLGVDAELVTSRLEGLRADDRIRLAQIPEEESHRLFVWLTPLFLAELGVAKELKRLKFSPFQLRDVDVDKAVDWVQKELKITLAKKQASAVKKAFSEKCHIITGGPGTGKSTIINCILKVTEKLTHRIVLAAPTGRAAKRMSEITGKKASTIHSLLEYNFRIRGFKRNRKNPLECDLIIVDEASMIDTVLMNQLLKALPDYARVIFVGDVNQLPSVGPGNVLNDLISSRKMTVTTLKEIFRQAKGSKIVTSAHLINGGYFPDLKNEANSDFFFIDMPEPEDVLQSILGLVTKRLPEKYGFDPLKDIQVLAPMKRGVIGTFNLNLVLQEQLTPQGNPLFLAGQKYLVGDRVMQMRNNYQREVYNGDVGWITSIDNVNQIVIVNIDGREVIYDFCDLDELALAYAVSIHKSQGSEFPCVVIPIHTQHFMLLHRNLLYTGVTRGKKLVVLVGTKKALAIAVKNDDVKKRYTALKEALAGHIDQMGWIS